MAKAKKRRLISKKASNKINWKIFINCLAVVFVVALIGSYFTKIDDWYYSVRPSITPPDWVFPIVWTLLFYLIAISIYYSWLGSGKNEKNKIIALFGANFILNILWSLFYFKMRNPKVAFVDLILLWFSILSLIIYNWKIDRKSSYLLIPYLLWVSFAGILNYLTI